VSAAPSPETFLSGRTGHVGPRRGVPLRAADALLDLELRLRGVPRRLDRLVATTPSREVLALCVYRPESDRTTAAASELAATKHRLRLAFGSTGAPRPELAAPTLVEGLAGGKFENLDVLLRAAGAGDPDWIVVVDDDVVLPERFLDRLLAVCEHFGLELAQPAQTLASHAAWPVTRRRRRSLARETRFVEIGPVTLFGRGAAAELLPFPELRYGWGLDLHWAAVARERGWRLGVVDAVPVRHDAAGVASSYPHSDALAEAQRFLSERSYLPAAEAAETLTVHRELE
jgi:hypothetical protein